MIDIHCHILFGVDDGPQELEDSIALGKSLVADGVTTVAATPHILNPPLSISEIFAGIEHLEKIFADQEIPLQILPGGENHYTLPVSEMRTHTINGGRYLLLEFPHASFPSNAANIVYSLRSAGLIPIIAHPERNAGLLRNPDMLEPLIVQGALSQLTAGSLAGDFGSPARQCARYLLKKNLAHFIATDAHGVNRRPPRLQAGLKEAARVIGKEHAMRLVLDNPKVVIYNREWHDA